jgi:hypothetical protein
MSLALLAVLEWWILQRMSARSLLIQTLNGLSFGAVLFFLASGFTLISGLMRVADLAHGGFYLEGGYIGFSVMRATPNFARALLSAGAGITVVGLFTARVLLRPIRRLEKPEVLLSPSGSRGPRRLRTPFRRLIAQGAAINCGSRLYL